MLQNLPNPTFQPQEFCRKKSTFLGDSILVTCQIQSQSQKIVIINAIKYIFKKKFSRTIRKPFKSYSFIHHFSFNFLTVFETKIAYFYIW